MYISKKWLKKYVPDIDSLSNDFLANKLTNSLAEVEGVALLGDKLERIVSGEIKSIKKHPDSEKLSVCIVNIGSEELQIVCGASNVAENAKVAVCLPEGSVYNPQTGERVHISATKIKGISSNGMLCSEKELSIGDDHSQILILPENYEVGLDLDDTFKDTVFEIENKSLTHRGDCFSHLGVAREIAAICDIEFNELTTENIIPQTEALPLEVEIDADNCNRFTVVTIKGVKVAPSPLWLKLALRSIGQRSINNIVDITNYLMHDSGQPLHTYDYRKIRDNKLIVRNARAGEKISAIDHKSYVLSDGNLLITDNDKVQNIAGIIGSEGSAVGEGTTDIILEAANFNPQNILATTRSLGIRSEAGVRNSKGVDLALTRNIITKAVELILDIAGGDVASEILDVINNPAEALTVKLDLLSVNRIAGVNVPLEDIVIYLERLGILVKNRSALSLVSAQINVPMVAELDIPSWRKDLNTPQDIAEEVIRIFGYDQILPRLPLRPTGANPATQFQKTYRRVGEILLRLGYDEVINYSFISKRHEDIFNLKRRQLLEVKNALSPELNYFRNSLIPGIVETFYKNIKLASSRDIFEIGRIIDNYSYTAEQIPLQPFTLAMLSGYTITGKDLPADSALKLDEFKGVVESLLHALALQQIEIEFKTYGEQDRLALSGLVHPYRAASIMIKNKNIGVVAEIDPRVTQKLGTESTHIFVCELNLELLAELLNTVEIEFKPISNLPAVARDISLWISPKLELGSLESFIRSQAAVISDSGEFELNLELLGEFHKSDNERSATFRLSIQPMQKTITDREANLVLEEILKKVRGKFRVTIR